MTEKNYDFRKRLRDIHRPARVNLEVLPESNECSVDESWTIVIPPVCAGDPVLQTAAVDFQDYLRVSMNVSIPIRSESSGPKIQLEIDCNVSGRLDAFLLSVKPGIIRVSARSGRGIFGGTVYIEDLMNLREAPFLEHTDFFCKPLIKTRGVHSGFGLDMFPDHHLNAIVHAGFTEICLFIRGIGTCGNSYCDIQDVIDRAERYGLDVIFYGLISAYKHPGDSDAETYFDHAFGSIFKHYPKAKGIMLAGESAEFPSQDPQTSGKRRTESDWHGIPDPRPSPGWWPCEDYPAWLKAVRDAIHKYNPDATISFCTYNWLWAPVEVRRKFLEAMPKKIQLRVPFEMFKVYDLSDGVRCQIMDYTISETDFSECCREEMRIAHELGVEIGVTALSCGTPWNFGTTPYVPAPLQWIKRCDSLRAAHENYHADNFYDSHHMGWWPSIITDLSRAVFRQSETNLGALLKKLTIRDYGVAAVDNIMEVWGLWSEAMTFYVASNENQYGPFRVGPSYPLVFHPNVTRTMRSKEIKFPATDHAHFGAKILNTFYQPFENSGQSPYPLRRRGELAKLTQMQKMWHEGVTKLSETVELIPESKRDTYNELLTLGKFIETFIITGINVNDWYWLNIKLLNTDERSRGLELLDQLEAIAKNEIKNAQNAIDYVDADSRLGWEPSMEYMTDRWHLEWKIKHAQTVLDGDMKTYRKMLSIGE